MEKLTSLIYNFNTDCYKQYTKVSPYLGDLLNDVLLEIEKFYYSDFWKSRFKRRLQEEKLDFSYIQLDIIQGTSTELKEDTQFKIFNENQSKNGVSNKDTLIGLNTNMSNVKLNNSHIKNVVMHEFGHRQYNQDSFKIVIDLNKKIIDNPELHIKNNEYLNKEDLKYFIDHNEIRQRIIPIIKEMRDNRWNLGEVYDKSENLKIDDIKDIFERDYILKLIDNLL